MMIKGPFLLVILVWPWWLNGQDTLVNERAAKEAVHRIVRHSGLQPSFLVRENVRVRTAVAFIKDKERVIEYNPVFMNKVLDGSRTNWAAISILAHEIAHHLLGHTLDPTKLVPGDELACDRYSGFILFKMGAALEEALSAIEVAGDPHGTQHHPPRHARKAAIEQGWEEAKALSDRTVPDPFVIQDTFRYVVRFTGDPNTYYINETDKLVWFNAMAEPIEFGDLQRKGDRQIPSRLTWSDEQYEIDHHNVLWKKAANGLQMKVGILEPFGRPGN